MGGAVMQNGEQVTIKGRDYHIGPLLSSGLGSYGHVFAATEAHGQPVALKIINAETMAQADPSVQGHWRAHLEREIAFLTHSEVHRSASIVRLLDHGLIDGQPVLVLERFPTNLGQWLAQQRTRHAPPPDVSQILSWATQIMDARSPGQPETPPRSRPVR